MANGDGAVRAILGPTNTGKTHLAIERMCAHSSGVMGFPLRLLAREVYDRVVRMKGEASVALITGEERITPPTARYWLCTVESMPVPNWQDEGQDFAFCAIDEAQLGTDPERGHVFTDRLLRARGREETLILGADTLRPLIRTLIPEAEIVTRPRFSTLRYAGSVKLSRLPPRSAVVAFSAEQVYALAEMLRRFKGGAAVVMGALSPATRNAQVAMFQRGEVDYLVATDAIGMGLNMDVSHVAFAGLEKFDGRRDRRLTIPEMAQIAGRAGRHQRDGSFGTLGLGGDNAAAFSDEEVLAIEEHRFRPLDHLYWRNSDLDFSDVRALIASLEEKSGDPLLRAAPLSIDLAVLKAIAEDPAVAAMRGKQARRLWAACGLPDFRKVGPMHHARMVRRVFSYIGEGGHIAADWFAAEVARLDNVQGDIEALADRLAGVRSWAYIAHRSDWLKEPARWAERTRAVEGRLSDALHSALTQRFVDRRTAVLVRDIGARGADALPVTVAADGEVSVGPEPIGHLAGFDFTVDPTARLADKRLLLAAAERRLGEELDRRAKELADGDDTLFTLAAEPGQPVAIGWNGHILARLAPGRSLTEPAVRTARALDRLSAPVRAALRARLERWVEAQVARHLGELVRLGRASSDPQHRPAVRALTAMLADAGGLLPRKALAAPIGQLDKDDRAALYRLHVRLGALDAFLPTLLKPEAQRWRAALMTVRGNQPMPSLPPPGAATLPASADRHGAALAYRRVGEIWLRIDLADRLAAYAHRIRAAGGGEVVDRQLATSLGLDEPAIARLMADVGFQPKGEAWSWRGQRRRQERPVAAHKPGNAFAAALADLKR
ncbi:helicase [Sphingomonas sp. KRR8]|uniref:helicase-related protein n=1 Tax=Sphingomonas sp. KRR8 TaxID=2942996 RepID=UPI002020810E|nr:helicase-related protein [Sphingomonas sp. KRR8]URD60281.1 helicase [Sphingomonas sp. KRR8]